MSSGIVSVYIVSLTNPISDLSNEPETKKMHILLESHKYYHIQGVYYSAITRAMFTIVVSRVLDFMLQYEPLQFSLNLCKW